MHFEPTAYKRHLMYELLNQPIPKQRHTLIGDAVPTLRLPLLKDLPPTVRTSSADIPGTSTGTLNTPSREQQQPESFMSTVKQELLSPHKLLGVKSVSSSLSHKYYSADKKARLANYGSSSSAEQDPLAESPAAQVHELLVHDSEYGDPIAEEEVLPERRYLSDEDSIVEEDPLGTTLPPDPLATYDSCSSEEEESSDYDDTASGQGEASDLPNIDIVKEEIEDLEEDVMGEEMKLLMRETGVQENKIDSMREKVVVYPFSNSPINTSKSRKRKKTPDNELAQQPLVSSVTELCNRLSASEKGDEFHQFGLNVAAQLRAMTLTAALEAQLEIQKILTTKRFEFLET